MAGQTLQEILAGLGVQQGTVAQVKKGRSEGKIIDKIIAKIKADLKAIDDNGEKIPVEVQSKTGKDYKKQFMWGAANRGLRKINFVINNRRWTDKRFSWSCNEYADAVIDTLEKILIGLDMLDDVHRGYLEKDAKAFLASPNKKKGERKAKKRR